jgi:hypothetical protein
LSSEGYDSDVGTTADAVDDAVSRGERFAVVRKVTAAGA